MNLIAYIKTLLGICPKCGGNLLYWRGCSHTPARTHCENGDYKVVHKGESASAIAYPLVELCPKCGCHLMIHMAAGVETKVCWNCGYDAGGDSAEVAWGV